MTENATGNGNAAAEQELRDLVAERVAAVQSRDAATLAGRPADDVITFDVLTPLNSQGSAAVADHSVSGSTAMTATSATTFISCRSRQRMRLDSAHSSTTSAAP